MLGAKATLVKFSQQLPRRRDLAREQKGCTSYSLGLSPRADVHEEHGMGGEGGVKQRAS